MHEAGTDEPRDGRLRQLAGSRFLQRATLPSPSVQAHAPNLMPLSNGDLACVWFGGTQEGMADISIHFARLEAGSDTWSEAERLIDDPTRSEQNPILFPAPDGRLLLLYTSQRGGHQDTAVVRYRSSDDLGVTWSAPATLVGEPGTFVRQPLVVRPDGAWLLPVFHCKTEPGEAWTGRLDTSSVCVSRDRGQTFARHPVPGSTGAVHMNILPLAGDDMIALYRSRWADRIHRSTSHDGGLGWTAPQPTALPNNNASIQATALRDGRLALVYNHSSAADATGRRLGLYDDLDDAPAASGSAAPAAPTAARQAFWGAPRAPLCLALSHDGGATWGVPMTLDTSDGYCMTNNSRDRRNRELSYPSIVETADGAIHVAYTYFRQAIRYLRIAPDGLAGH